MAVGHLFCLNWKECVGRKECLFYDKLLSACNINAFRWLCVLNALQVVYLCAIGGSPDFNEMNACRRTIGMLYLGEGESG